MSALRESPEALPPRGLGVARVREPELEAVAAAWCVPGVQLAEPGGEPVLDSRVADLCERVELLAAAVGEAGRGALGISATGLDGDVDANLQALARASQQLEALTLIAAGKADHANEGWLGTSALLQRVSKATTADVSRVRDCQRLAAFDDRVTAAWLDGSVSEIQLRHIWRTLRQIPATDQAAVIDVLLTHAPTLTHRELVRATTHLIGLANPALVEKRVMYEESKVHFVLADDGEGYHATGWFTYEQGGWLRAVLDAQVGVRAAGDMRSRAELYGEALVTIARTYAESDVIPTLSMARPRLVVLCTADDLRRMAAESVPGELALTSAGDVLDPYTVRRVMSDADVAPMLADFAVGTEISAELRGQSELFERAARRARRYAVRGRATDVGIPSVMFRMLTTPVRPVVLGREVRVVPGWLRDAVAARDHHCVVSGCDMPPQRCEVHHVVPWADGGASDIDNLALLCLRHHRRVELGTWRLRPRRAGDGPGRYWVSESVGG